MNVDKLPPVRKKPLPREEPARKLGEYHLLQFTILLALILTTRSAYINSSIVNQTTPENEQYSNETAIKIEALQKEKDDLYSQINKAIDEAIPELERTNNTESITGLQHLKTLKQQLKEIHEADTDEEATENFSETSNSTGFRRKISINIDRKRHKGKAKGAGNWASQLQKDEFYKKLVKNREKSYTSLPNVLNRQKIAGQIQEWLTKKAEEKKKIMEYKAKMKVDYERCPNYGKGKTKKRKNGKKDRKDKYYPCCRKCCKKSYLGCL